MAPPLSLDPAFGRLGREIPRFANHTHRLLRASKRLRPQLEMAALWSEGAAPLAQTPADPSTALRAIDKFARVHRHDRCELLGAYFSHHHLRLEAERSRLLLRGLYKPVPEARAAVLRQAYEHAESTRRQWIATLLELSILAAAPDLSRKEFAAFNVGSLTDHEDVDLAIVVPSLEAQEGLAKAFATVSRTFVRYVSKIQMFLTEELASASSGARIEAYAELLERPTRSVVSVMQLLGAQFLCGDEPLARALNDRVIKSYYSGQGSPIVHEGFLRGVMSELRYHLFPRVGVAGVLSPKREVYVPAKLVTTALRVIYGVQETRPAYALEEIAERAPDLEQSCRTLSEVFIQNEVLRSLLFLYVFPSDEFDLLDRNVRAASRRVSLLFGLRARHGEDLLHTEYVAMRDRGLGAIAALANGIEDHLARVSTFRRIVEHQQKLPAVDNLVLHLLEALERYKGSVFWDEVLNPLNEDRKLGERFTDDLWRLTASERPGVARRYAMMLGEDAPSLIEFLVFLSRQDRLYPVDPPRSSSDIFFDAMVDHFSQEPEALRRFSQSLDTETTSDSLYRLAVAHAPASLATLADLVGERDGSNHGFRVARALRSSIVLAHHHSHAIGRVSSRVLGRQPEFLPRVGDGRRLEDLYTEIAAEASREARPRERIELLGDALDVVTLRSALTAVLEGEPEALDVKFTSAVDAYVRELMKACRSDVVAGGVALPAATDGDSGFALYATGGYGRGEAFGADWDYLAVIDEDDPERKRFFGRILQRVSAAMARRGLHPHNRFTDHFNAYVVSLPELVSYFDTRSDETFIDEAEVLEARFFLGDPVLARRFNEEVRALLFESHTRPFMFDILKELRDRRRTPPRGLNIKLGPGGLREIHLLWLAIRVVAGLPGPLVESLLPEAQAALPKVAGDLAALMSLNHELRRTRDLYRLVVAIDDAMVPDALIEVARDLLPLRKAGFVAGFEDRLRQTLDETADRVDRVAAELEGRLT